MRKPKITIITPSFNQGQYIEQTIDSVLSQNYENLEYIVIDGGSTDNTVAIIRKYEQYLSHWVSEKDNGQGHAINKGLKHATGDVINWLNSDDYYQPGALNLIGNVFSDPSVKVLCAKSRKFSSTSEFTSKGTDVYRNNLAKTIGWARIDQPETFFRKNAYDSLGGVNESFHYLMDRDFWVRYLLKYGLDGIVQIDDILVNFRLHETSKTVSQAASFQKDHDTIFLNLARATGDERLAEIIENKFETNPGIKLNFPACSKTLVHVAVIYFLLHRAHELYYQQDYKLCRELLGSIDPNLLNQEDKRLLRKLTLRSNFFLSRLFKLVKEWKHNSA